MGIQSLDGAADIAICAQGPRVMVLGGVVTATSAITILAASVLGMNEKATLSKESCFIITGIGTMLTSTVAAVVTSYFLRRDS